MVIESSAVAMSSGRTYVHQTRDRSSVRGWGEVLNATTSPAARDSRTVTQRETEVGTVELYQNYSVSGSYVTQSHRHPRDEDVKFRPMTLIEFFHYLIEQRRADFKRFMENYRIGMGVRQAEIAEGEVMHNEVEYESLEYSAGGTVTTLDGRKIDFDVGLLMERSHVESWHAEADFVDPLVINFGGGGVELRDREFSFDLDTDGELDSIAILGQTCGYLALDINADGEINNGSELFGTKSGDGFKDLAVYDADGNGWIDENDPVFDKLKIWTIDPDGTNHLVGLGVRGVGAIFLGSAMGDFSVKNVSNETLGVVRSTGVFLREDGSAGTIQQVDLAKRPRAV